MQIVGMLQTKNLILAKKLQKTAATLSELNRWYQTNKTSMPGEVFLEIYARNMGKE